MHVMGVEWRCGDLVCHTTDWWFLRERWWWWWFLVEVGSGGWWWWLRAVFYKYGDGSIVMVMVVWNGDGVV